MTEEYEIVSDKRNIQTLIQEWDSPVTIAAGSNTRKLLTALLHEADSVDDDIEDIYNAHHINSASGDVLELFGQLVGVYRNTDESDDKYRTRIKAEFRQGTIEPTFDNFTEFCATVLNTNINNLEFILNLSGDPATVDIGINEAVLDNVALTNTEVEELLSGGVPAGHDVKVFLGGTFRLKSDGETDDVTKGLTSDTIDSGGTLAEDLIT